MATIIWLAISGGVMMAARTKTTISEYFLYFLKNSGVTKPNLVRKYIKIGNSKINPEAITEARTKLMYEFKSISLNTWSLTV